MSTPLLPLPDRDPLTATEVAAALGIRLDTVTRLIRLGWFPFAFRTLSLGNGPGAWRIPHAAALAAGRQMGLWP